MVTGKKNPCPPSIACSLEEPLNLGQSPAVRPSFLQPRPPHCPHPVRKLSTYPQMVKIASVHQLISGASERPPSYRWRLCDRPV